ncbi:MAG: class I SAM-dependent methyltransferase [Nitrospinota bacterium]|nr:MAG: class I SAM-dependent methyltransferase [Nitrospinota bacterium]
MARGAVSGTAGEVEGKPVKPRMLSYQQAKAFYDRWGKKQDWQRFYEDVATAALLRNGEFDKASAVLEFGCGTGWFGERLLEGYLPAHARYVGLDISDTMVALAQERLRRFGRRAEVLLTDGAPRLNFETATFDRFVSNYVLDLLTFADIRVLLHEAWRVLSEGGLLGLTSLTHGFTPLSRVVERVWTAIHAIRPTLVGGCRPISLLALVSESGWRIRYNEKFSRYGVPSEVLVAEVEVC